MNAQIQHNQQMLGGVGDELVVDDTNFELLVDSQRENDYLEMLGKMKCALADRTSECELLKIKLDQSVKDKAILTDDLNRCKMAMFQNSEDARKTHEEMMRSKKLEEHYIKLMADYLNLSEQCQHYKQSMYDNYLEKSNAINNYEYLMSSETLSSALEDCRKNLNKRSAEISLVSAKLRNQEEEKNIKEKCITELRKSLDDAKVTHKHEIKVLEDYIDCLKNTITSYEKTLTDLMDEQTVVATAATTKTTKVSYDNEGLPSEQSETKKPSEVIESVSSGHG